MKFIMVANCPGNKIAVLLNTGQLLYFNCIFAGNEQKFKGTYGRFGCQYFIRYKLQHCKVFNARANATLCVKFGAHWR